MKFDFKRKVLSNGMTVLFEKRNLPVVSVAFAVRNGAVNESLEEKGISHFIEHLLYKGTSKRSAKQITEEIEKNGGELNGFTGEDITAFWCKMPSESLNLALDVLSDIIKNSVFDEKELEKERNVIFEEIKLYHDSPIHHVYTELQKYLYEGTLSMSILGTTETLNSLDRKNIIDKFKKVYAPNNLILCVVGDADFDELVKFAEDNFGEEKGEVPKMEIKIKNGSEIEKRQGIDQANLILAYHVPLANDKKSYAARVLNVMMADGLSSRLFQEIREKRNLAYAIRGGSEIRNDFAYNMIYVGTAKDKVEEVKKLILEEFEKVVKDFDEKELNDIKKQIIGNYKISMEDSQGQMVNLLGAEIEGDAFKFYEFEKNISEVIVDDVKELAKNVGEKYSFFALVPED
jgi:predicted Zn-dependent peptidase